MMQHAHKLNDYCRQSQANLRYARDHTFNRMFSNLILDKTMVPSIHHEMCEASRGSVQRINILDATQPTHGMWETVARTVGDPLRFKHTELAYPSVM